MLALHFEEGRDLEKAIRYLAAAAESSPKRFANQEAAVYLTRALSLADRMPGGDVALTARLDLLRQRGWVLRAAGDFPGSFADIAAMIAHAGEAKRPLVEVTGLLDLSRFCLYVDRSRCLELARQALVKSEELDDDAIKALARGNNANLNLMLNRWRAEDAELCRQTLRTLADARDPRIVLRRCSIESVLHFLTSNYRGCCDSARLGQEITRAIGDVYYFVLFNVLEAFAYLNLGEWRLLQQSVKAALAMTEKNANRQATVLCQLSLGFLETEALDFASAKRRAEMALDRTVEANPFNFFLGRNLLAKAHLGLREYHAAWSHFEQIRHKIEVEGVSMDSSIYPQYYYNLGEFWLEQGDVERARAQALQLNVRAAESKEQTYLALAQRQLGDIARLEGRFDDAGAHLAHAAAIVEATEVPLAAWRVHASAAQLYETIGDMREAAASQARSDGVVAFLADKFAEDDPLRASLLENYAGEARRVNSVSPAVLKYRAAPTAGALHRMAKTARRFVNLEPEPHDRPERAMRFKTAPRRERKRVVGVDAPRRTVGVLRRYGDLSDRLLRRQIIRPFDRRVLDRHSFEVGAELRANLIFGGLGPEELHDEIAQHAVRAVRRNSSQPANRLRKRGRA